MRTRIRRGLVAGAVAGLVIACSDKSSTGQSENDDQSSEATRSDAANGGMSTAGAKSGVKTDAGTKEASKEASKSSAKAAAGSKKSDDEDAGMKGGDAPGAGAADKNTPATSKSDAGTTGDSADKKPADKPSDGEMKPTQDGEPTQPTEPKPEMGDKAPQGEDKPKDMGLPTSCRSDVAPTIPALSVETVIQSGSLDTLTYAVQPPGSNDWYLTSQRGRIVIVRDGKLLDTPFLDLRNEISLGAGFDQTTITYDERGLNGLAFAPDYATSGLFYIAITPSAPDNPVSPGLRADHDQVLEYRRSQDNPDRADPSPTRSLVDLGSSAALLGNIHNINTVKFGPDGYLYAGSGDGGSVSCGSAEPGAQQDIHQQYGKILRLDPRGEWPFGVSDNPFAGESGAAATVLHYGVRNPFRFSFDRLTGDLYFGDVGQSTYEEFNFAPASSKGLNFGWPALEAKSRCPGGSGLRSGSTPTEPIFFADRNGGGPFRDYRAPVGGVVYRGSAIPELNGTYVFGDYYGQRLGALQQCENGTSPIAVIRKNCDPNFPEACLSSGRYVNELTAIVEGNDSEIYLVANGDSLLKVVKGN